MNNFRHIEATKTIFFSKCSKSYVDFENAIKPGENFDGFEDNCVWTCCMSLKPGLRVSAVMHYHASCVWCI